MHAQLLSLKRGLCKAYLSPRYWGDGPLPKPCFLPGSSTLPDWPLCPWMLEPLPGAAGVSPSTPPPQSYPALTLSPVPRPTQMSNV